MKERAKRNYTAPVTLVWDLEASWELTRGSGEIKGKANTYLRPIGDRTYGRSHSRGHDRYTVFRQTRAFLVW